MEIDIDTAAKLAELLCCIVILARTEPALNRMDAETTPPLIRIAFALLATGAAAGILALFAGQTPSLPTLVLTAGTAAMTFCERRIRYLAGSHRRHNRKGLPDAQR